MTTSTGMYMETVSLNDDAPSGPAPSSTSASTTPGGEGAVLDVDSLEAQFAPPATVKFAAKATDMENGHAHSIDQVVVVVGSDGSANSDDRDGNCSGLSNGSGSRPHEQHDESQVVKNKPVLPKLRVPPLKTPNAQYMEERDYVDPTLFSPEVSRHAMEVAHRRAKAIAVEVKEMLELEGDQPASSSSSGARFSPVEAVGIISNAFLSSFSRVKQIVKSGDTEYDLLAGSSPSSKMEDLDTDGDGLQISPDASKGDGKHFQSPSIRPALKRISAYTAIPTEKPHRQKKSLHWHDDVLDGDEEFVDDGEDDLDGSGGESSPRETNSLVLNGNSILNYNKGGDLTPRSKKKRKKLVKTMMRRLTPREKEELYRQRPDLMIVPNWAQKYREEIAGEETSRSSLWLVMFITLLAVLLIVLIFLIERQHARANKE